VLILDESADQAGEKMAGAGRQHNGRLGKVEMSWVGALLAYVNLTDVNRPLWAWVDGELYLQAHWLTPEMAEERQRVGIPPERRFETKIELGWKMIQRVEAQGLPLTPWPVTICTGGVPGCGTSWPGRGSPTWQMSPAPPGST